MTNWILAIGWPLLVSTAIKGLFVLALAGIVALVLRGKSAGTRHMVWWFCIAGLLAQPYVSLFPAGMRIPLARPSALIRKDAPIVVPSTNGSLAAEWINGPDTSSGATTSSYSENIQRASDALSSEYRPSRRYVSPVIWLFSLWALGAFACLVPTFIGLFRIMLLTRRSHAVTEGPILSLVDVLAKLLDYNGRVRLLFGGKDMPLTCGAFTPVILLPSETTFWPEERQRAVLLHELAHIARFDWTKQMLSLVVCALFWYNPVVWLLARQMRLQSEIACDDQVLLAGVPAPEYATHLLDVARSAHDKPSVAAVPMVSSHTLVTRLQAVLEQTRIRGKISKKMMLLLVCCLFYPMLLTDLVGFALPLPPTHAVLLDPESYRIMIQVNQSTAALSSLSAQIHDSASPPEKTCGCGNNDGDDDDNGGTILLQRPNLARIEVPGPKGFTFISDGVNSETYNHDGSADYVFPVDATGWNMTSGDDSNPLVQYFFDPDFHRIGVDEISTPDVRIFPRYLFPIGNDDLRDPIPVVGHYVGVRRWRGADYQVVMFTRDYVPEFKDREKNTTTVYVGSDNLIHRIVGKDYSVRSVSTDDIYLTNIRLNDPSPAADFILPLEERKK